jgi:hypothetical protein
MIEYILSKIRIAELGRGSLTAPLFAAMVYRPPETDKAESRKNTVFPRFPQKSVNIGREADAPPKAA